MFFSKVQNLEEFVLLKNVSVSNEVFEHIVKNCFQLTKLALGGEEKNYNYNITLDGIETLCLTHS